MSESEVRSEAKKQGYTQEQIERVIDQEKRKVLKIMKKGWKQCYR